MQDDYVRSSYNSLTDTEPNRTKIISFNSWLTPVLREPSVEQKQNSLSSQNANNFHIPPLFRLD